MSTRLGVAACLAATALGWSAIAYHDYAHPKVYVIDGDTVVRRGAHYRLVGFDTPELRNPRCPREHALAFQAMERTRYLFRTGAVITDVGGNCAWGRRCAIATYRGHDLGDILISEGLAHPMICKSGICPPKESWCHV